MRYLITGANGVVGKNLWNILSDYYDLDIWGCGRSYSSKMRYITLDLMDRQAVIDCFSKERFDCVIHCAADISSEFPFEMFSNNIVSTLNVVEACLLTNVRKVFHTSGIPVIGNILELPITEDHPTKPYTAYHLSKLHSEEIIEQYCKGKIDFINMRIPSPVGLNMPLRSVFPIFLDAIKKNENVTLTGSPNRKQNFLDLRDLANFIYKASWIDGISGVFNVASQNAYSNLDLAKAIIHAVGSSSKIINKMGNESDSIEVWDVSTLKAEKNFNFKPQHTLSDTIKWVI